MLELDSVALRGLAMSELLQGKHLLVTGVMTRRSIAFSVARRAQELGAELVLTSFGRVRRLTERTARQLHEPVEILELDVTKPEHFVRLRDDLERHWGSLDGVLHSVAFAPADAIGGNFISAPVESASSAFEVSAFSMKALAEVLVSLAPEDRGGSLVGMDFDASVAWPRYDWMGVAKAALESVSRYISRYLGPHAIRSNLVAAGMLDTAATAGLGSGWEAWVREFNARSPLGWDPEDAGPVADAVCFLFSDMARGISGEILHVDGGLHAMAGQIEMPEELGRTPEEPLEPVSELQRDPVAS